MRKRYVKVFGERNTGTNFLNQLIERNVDVEVLAHGGAERINRRVRQFPEDIRPFVRERLIDQERGREIESFGWKHARAVPAELRRAERFEATVFVFLVRNPFYFLRSLYRRPYNVFPRKWKDRGAFLRSPILVNERDRLEDLYLPTPVDLWNLKTASYLAASDELEAALLLRYEDLVADPRAALRPMEAFGCSVSAAFEVPTKSTKNDALSYGDYQKIAREFDPAHEFPQEDVNFVRSRLDADLCTRLGYGE